MEDDKHEDDKTVTNVGLSEGQFARLLERLKPSSPETPKINPWVQVLIVPVLIACFGAAATFVYNRQQDQLNRTQTLEKFLLYFDKGKPTQQKIVASRILVELGYADLATDLLLLNPDEAKNESENDYPFLSFLESQAEVVMPRLCELAYQEPDSARGRSAAEYVGALYQAKSARPHILHILSSRNSSDERISGALFGLKQAFKEERFGRSTLKQEDWKQEWEPLESELLRLYSTTSDRFVKADVNELLGQMSLSPFSKSNSLVKDILLNPDHDDYEKFRTFEGIRNDGGELSAVREEGGELSAVREEGEERNFTDEAWVWDLMKSILFDKQTAQYSTVRFKMAYEAAAYGRFQNEFFQLLRTGSDNDRQIALAGIQQDPAKRSVALTRLLDAYSSEGNPSLRLGILDKMRSYPNDSRSLDLVLASVKSRDRDFREAAYANLARFPSEKAHEALRNGISEKDHQVLNDVLIELANSCNHEDWTALSQVLSQRPRDKGFQRLRGYLAGTRKRCQEKRDTQ